MSKELVAAQRSRKHRPRPRGQAGTRQASTDLLQTTRGESPVK